MLQLKTKNSVWKIQTNLNLQNLNRFGWKIKFFLESNFARTCAIGRVLCCANRSSLRKRTFKKFNDFDEKMFAQNRWFLRQKLKILWYNYLNYRVFFSNCSPVGLLGNFEQIVHTAVSYQGRLPDENQWFWEEKLHFQSWKTKLKISIRFWRFRIDFDKQTCSENPMTKFETELWKL